MDSLFSLTILPYSLNICHLQALVIQIISFKASLGYRNKLWGWGSEEGSIGQGPPKVILVPER